MSTTPRLARLRLAACAAALALAATALAATAATRVDAAVDHETCRPDGLYKTADVTVPYCDVYDENGREKMGADHPRRVIGYFTGWRHGQNGQPAYLASNIPWSKITHINYAFAHVGPDNRISVGADNASNPATGMTFPGQDPALPYKGHFNLLNTLKKQNPHAKTLISVGGWAESGGYFDDAGNRQASGGFYTMTDSQAAIDTFADSAVSFIRKYGFNGVDIDYEYPTSMKDAGNPLDFQIANARRATLMGNYVKLMKSLRERLDRASAQDGKYYLLTIAAPASGYLLRGMETFQVTQYLDYVNIMSYDLHGAWNEFVGPNAALYDDGKDAELAKWGVYTTSQYGGIGYLNTDWAYHYFRGAMPPGRINIGVPYYTRGWKNVNGGTNGLWGTAPKSSGCPTGLTTCGDGAIGIDNVWHDLDGQAETPGGGNPMWHAKNLERGIQGSYIGQYGLDPVNDPNDRISGTYARHYDSTLVAPWLWNSSKKVFLSTEDEQSIRAKAEYVRDTGLGGMMIWELAGDYKWTGSEYFMGDTLTTLAHDTLKTAAPYNATRAKVAIPAEKLDITIEAGGFPVGDSNYPISAKLKITNRSAVTVPGGAEFQWDYSAASPPNAKDQSGFGLTVIGKEHTGANNIGGLKGDYNRVSVKLPAWQSLAPGASVTMDYVYYLPAPGPNNYTVTFGGRTYGLVQDLARGGTVVTPTASPTVTPTGGTCTEPPWEAGKIYTGGQRVSHKGKVWEARWWSQNNEPGTNDVWREVGLCSGPTSSPTITPTVTSSPTITPTVTSSPTVTPTVTSSPTVTPTVTSSPTVTPTVTSSPTVTPTGTYPAWRAGTAYAAGDRVTYQGVNYQCRQPHTALAGWEPSNVPALWQRL
ncbi:chitinase C-terminal domain-containing protein [Nonomuraea soli]|uniref:Chitinase n=1 Tax=Nonomuraea soli TaxID=1032476 RepID=A0A7W0HRJ8_9ACTN|nr:glycosyl hydrolase family 18 protein [Nonomuraea soli]MBA2893079.1 chitinase [Nonomuraea soli]